LSVEQCVCSNGTVLLQDSESTKELTLTMKKHSCVRWLPGQKVKPVTSEFETGAIHSTVIYNTTNTQYIRQYADQSHVILGTVNEYF